MMIHMASGNGALCKRTYRLAGDMLSLDKNMVTCETCLELMNECCDNDKYKFQVSIECIKLKNELIVELSKVQQSAGVRRLVEDIEKCHDASEFIILSQECVYYLIRSD